MSKTYIEETHTIRLTRKQVEDALAIFSQSDGPVSRRLVKVYKEKLARFDQETAEF